MRFVLVPFLPPPRNPAADALLGEVPLDLISDALYDACELVERFVSDWAIAIAQRLELEPDLAEGRTADAILSARTYPDTQRPALAWLLARLAEAGDIEAVPETTPPVYRQLRPFRTPELAELRKHALELEPAILPTLTLLDAAGEAFPDVLTGRVTGEQALFSGARMQLWLDYFNNANLVYAINNRIAAVAAANRLPPPSAAGLRILEVGAGAGSAADALLEVLRERNRLGEIVEYRLTEPNPMLRRRASRTLAAKYPGLAMTDSAYDFDQDPATQGLLAESFDLVFSVNVLHIARSLRGSLTALRSLLKPGGWLIGGECQRLFPHQTIAVELIFEQLQSFTQVELDAEVRTNHGFLTPEQWNQALAATGYVEVGHVPDLTRLRFEYARFFSGAVCARRPEAAP
ncbi:MAG: SAM-dependent methyltransferase [Thermoanaerobaculia bacterium]